MDSGEKVQLIDVRQHEEYAFAKIEGSKLIPLGELPSRIGELDPTRDVIFQCKSGVRSARAVEFVQQSGYPGKAKNLRGGITAWSNEVDPKVPKY
jgi:sulfur-carrier protein adenylyltransferase/sulfurtransferase